MNDKLVECDFHIEACKNRKQLPAKIGAYKVYINFYLDEAKTQLVSTRKLTITKEPHTVGRIGPPVYDIYSYNGVSTSKKSKLLGDKNFSVDTLQECAATIAVFKTLQSSLDTACQLLFVLDVKNFPQHAEDRSYTNKRSIEASEQQILAFLRTDSPAASLQAKQFRALLLSTSLSYVLLEGGLKAAFIEDDFLSESEKQFLQTRGTGCVSFCQLIEFFLNAFKRGEEITIKKGVSDTGQVDRRTFNRTPYLKKLWETDPDYVPTERSHTIYPNAYYDIATKGIYTKSMRHSTLFHTKTIEHDDQVVEMITIQQEVA